MKVYIAYYSGDYLTAIAISFSEEQIKNYITECKKRCKTDYEKNQYFYSEEILSKNNLLEFD